MDDESRIERIFLMEDRFDRVSIVVRELEKHLSMYEKLTDDIKALEEYLSSKEWREDFEADEKGLVPSTLKRTVLSEDGLFNLLEKNDELRYYARNVFGIENSE